MSKVKNRTSRMDQETGRTSILETPSTRTWVSGLSARGRLSLQEVTRILGTEPNIPLGDGGLLVNALLEASPPKPYVLGIIPPLIERHEPVFSDVACQVPYATLIELSRDPLYVLDQIAACDTILSSARYGLIAADALGIPNRWMRVSEAVLGGAFKFHDYYSVYALEGIKPWVVADVCAFGKRLPEVIANEYADSRMHVAEIQQTLLKAFPNLSPPMGLPCKHPIGLFGSLRQPAVVMPRPPGFPSRYVWSKAAGRSGSLRRRNMHPA